MVKKLPRNRESAPFWENSDLISRWWLVKLLVAFRATFSSHIMKSMKRMDRNILAIDLKSFYASVECLDRNRDPFQTPLVVADEERGDGTIVLAASP